ncbi:hypothetical protein QJ857_gp1325 [Tupanvirus soda lake]|uniref:Uncharacterized protein n=2 Tax=Tupanvirus TaxID=2094720 RepID=A0A6N1NPK8_9VIRU|nr:hypothetical protein QJ857_gp1325 [Tupanvirus soda lake]QKU34737.1 hypothetical protein [Tupanvirus soda lake]
MESSNNTKRNVIIFIVVVIFLAIIGGVIYWMLYKTPNPTQAPITPPVSPVTPPQVNPVTPPQINPVTPPQVNPATPPPVNPVTPPIAPAILNPTDWACIENIYTPLQVNQNNEIQCASTDGNNCLWLDNETNCQKELVAVKLIENTSILRNELKPVVCTNSQYNQPGHWCYNSKAYYLRNN